MPQSVSDRIDEKPLDQAPSLRIVVHVSDGARRDRPCTRPTQWTATAQSCLDFPVTDLAFLAVRSSQAGMARSATLSSPLRIR